MTQLKAIKNQYKKENGGYDMCKGMDDWLKHKEKEGLSKGLELGRNEGLSKGLELGRNEGLT